jgi:adenylate kinase family enzyme
MTLWWWPGVTKLLLCGLSGAGKTTTGNQLAALGWTHFDCEKDGYEPWAGNSSPTLPDDHNVVASWGFLPVSIEAVETLTADGFRLVWLWGEQKFLEAALRERGEDTIFINSPLRVEQRQALSLIVPDMIINTFRPDGLRWDVAGALHEAYWEGPVVS